MSTLSCKTYRTSFVAVQYIFLYKAWTFDIKFSLTVETTVSNSQQLFLSCLLIYIIYSLTVMPEIQQYSEYLIFQQDGAPAHRARETVELLKEVTPDFIQPSLWPPNSPDLNPVDYAIWGIMQEKVYNKGKIANVEELRQRMHRGRVGTS